MQFHDLVSVQGKVKLPDGRMVVDARFARAGIYVYSGTEVGKPELAQVRVYRPPEEVFDADSMASFAHKAVTDDHPPVMVDASNWTDYSKGYTDGKVKRDGEFVKVPMMLANASLVDAVDEGKKELSAGYDADITFEVGITGDGEHYDAVMRHIRGNHIAVVDKGRAGAECSIADKGVDHMNAVTTKIITFDGLPVCTTDAGEAVIVKLQGLLKDAGTVLERTVAEHTAAIAAKDGELATRDAKIADLESKVLDDAALDAKVAERATLLNDVKLLAPTLDAKGKSVADLRRAAVTEATPEASRPALKDKSEDYITVMFDALVTRARDRSANDGTGSGGGDLLAAALGDTLPGGSGSDAAPRTGSTAYQAMVDRATKAWETPTAEAA